MKTAFIPIELLERIVDSLGSFVSDHGWSQADMDTYDEASLALTEASRERPDPIWASSRPGDLDEQKAGIEETITVGVDRRRSET